jgi:hypothetical protein
VAGNRSDPSSRAATAVLSDPAWVRLVIEVTDCPECGIPAEVQSWTTARNARGLIEQVRTLCFHGHLRLVPRDTLVTRRLAGSWGMA